MTFTEAFDSYILNQKVIGWSFQQPTLVKLPNGDDAFACGYFTEYENGYKLMICGKTIGEADVQEAMIIDAEGVPIASDTKDLDYSEIGK